MEIAIRQLLAKKQSESKSDYFTLSEAFGDGKSPNIALAFHEFSDNRWHQFISNPN